MDEDHTDEGSVFTDDFSKENLQSWIEDYNDDDSIAFSDDCDFEMTSEQEEHVIDDNIEEEIRSEVQAAEEFTDYQYYRLQYGAHISEYTSTPQINTREVTSVACEVRPGDWPPGVDIMHAQELDLVTMILETLSGFQNDLFLRISDSTCTSYPVVYILTHTARHIALPSLSCGALTSLLRRVASFTTATHNIRTYITAVTSLVSGIGLDACDVYYRSVQCEVAVVLQSVVSSLDAQICDMDAQLASYKKQLENDDDDNVSILPVTLLQITLLMSKWSSIISAVDHIISSFASPNPNSDKAPLLLRALHRHCTLLHISSAPASLSTTTSSPLPHDLQLQLSMSTSSIHSYTNLANTLYISLLRSYLSHHLQHIWSGGQSSFSFISDTTLQYLDPPCKHLVQSFNSSSSDVHLMSRFPRGLQHLGSFKSSRDYLRAVDKTSTALQLCLRVIAAPAAFEEAVVIDISEAYDLTPYPALSLSNIADLCGNIIAKLPRHKEASPAATVVAPAVSTTALENDLHPLSVLISSLVTQPLLDVLCSLQLSAMRFYHRQYHLRQHLRFLQQVFLLSDSAIFTPLRELVWNVAMAESAFTYDIFDTIRSNILSIFPDSESKCNIPYRDTLSHQSIRQLFQFASVFTIEVYFVYPLNELFHDASIMTTYSTTMSHLLRLYACIWIIEGIWKKLSATESNLAQVCKPRHLKNERSQRMFILRNRCMIRLSWLMYMLKGIQFYYMNTVHAEIYDAFLSDAEKCPSIAAFRRMHQDTLDKISLVLSLEKDTIDEIISHCITSVISLDDANAAADVYSGFAHSTEEQELVATSLELANKEFSKLWGLVHRLHSEIMSVARRRNGSMLPEYAVRMKGLIGDEFDMDREQI